jgi:hypothetical protein
VLPTLNGNGKPKQITLPLPPVYTLLISQVLSGDAVAPPWSAVLMAKAGLPSKSSLKSTVWAGAVSTNAKRQVSNE